MRGFNSRNLFLTVLEAGKSKVRTPARPIPGKSSLPGLQMAAFSVCFLMMKKAVASLPLFISVLALMD